MENTFDDLRLEEIRSRLFAFVNAGTNWRITITNPYTSVSASMQEHGSHPEKVMGDFMNNVISDMGFLLDECSGSD